MILNDSQIIALNNLIETCILHGEDYGWEYLIGEEKCKEAIKSFLNAIDVNDMTITEYGFPYIKRK